MELNTYIQQVRDGVNSAAALADENTQQIAQRLGGTVESSMRLALIEALSDATAEISHELAPGSVELRMQGSTPQFVVAQGDAEFDPNLADDDSDEVDVLDGELDDDVDTEQDELDDTQVRLTLRLPKWVKDKVDTYAAEDGVSVNTWLAEVVMAEHAARRPRRGEHRGERRGGPGGFGGGNRPGGFGPIPREAAEALQFVFGPNGPLAGRGRGFGPGGPFGPQGPWGQGGPRRHQDGPDRPRRDPDADGADESHRDERQHRERDGGRRNERDGDRPKKHGGSHGGKKRSRAEREHHENRSSRRGGGRSRDW
ncbi:MAG: hypothetical protein ABI137_14095 [Antricoccus sp.]